MQVSSAPSFTVNWYNSVGVTIILVQLGDVFNAHIEAVLKYFKYLVAKRKATENPANALTQEELNKCFVGPEFEFAFSYAQLMSTFFVTLTFATGIPLLYPIAAANFLLYYIVEKYLFITLYKIPPHFNTAVGRRASSLIPIAILFHIAMSIWMLSNKTIFNNENSGAVAEEYYYNAVHGTSSTSSSSVGYDAKERVTQKATLPLFVLFFILLFLWFGIYVSKFVNKGLEKVSVLVLC
jgi:hypothetical protein